MVVDNDKQAVINSEVLRVLYRTLTVCLRLLQLSLAEPDLEIHQRHLDLLRQALQIPQEFKSTILGVAVEFLEGLECL